MEGFPCKVSRKPFSIDEIIQSSFVRSRTGSAVTNWRPNYRAADGSSPLLKDEGAVDHGQELKKRLEAFNIEGTDIEDGLKYLKIWKENEIV